MSFQIVVDSCCDLTPEMRGSGLYHNVPLTIYVGESAFRDDMALDTQDLVDAMAMCQEASHTACPAPADYLSMFERCDGDLYVVTLSALLSGSHNSAWQASRLFLEEHPERNIHVFNSCSASSGETLIAAKIAQLAGAGLPFAEVVETVDRYITEMNTLFVLENLDNLKKAGRLTRVQSLVTGALRVKLVMGSTPEGEICKHGQALSIKQALNSWCPSCPAMTTTGARSCASPTACAGTVRSTWPCWRKNPVIFPMFSSQTPGASAPSTPIRAAL